MIYLKKFDNHAAYEAAESSLILPNVSLCVNENEVHYNPYVDPSGGHPFVEIGGIKWATMNVGANSITDTGLYFQWGDTQGYTASEVGTGSGQKAFKWEDYKYWTADTGSGSSGVTKYNSNDNKTVLDAEDDAAVANWGGNWRMPTEADFNALSAATTNAWVTDYQGSGVNGRLFTDTTDSSKVLFFPAAGFCENGSVGYVGSNGYCWSSSLNTSNVYSVSGRYLNFYGSTCIMGNYNRRYGCSVRGVIG